MVGKLGFAESIVADVVPLNAVKYCMDFLKVA